MKRVAIVGSRDYPNLDEVREFVRSLPPGSVVISGGARGVDKAAQEEAEILGLEVVIHYADWDRYGHAAGHIRNRIVVDDCDELIAFWDGESTGTKATMGLARKHGKLIAVRGAKVEDDRQGSLF